MSVIFVHSRCLPGRGNARKNKKQIAARTSPDLLFSPHRHITHPCSVPNGVDLNETGLWVFKFQHLPNMTVTRSSVAKVRARAAAAMHTRAPHRRPWAAMMTKERLAAVADRCRPVSRVLPDLYRPRPIARFYSDCYRPVYVRFQPDLYRPGVLTCPGLVGANARYRRISRQQVADYVLNIPEHRESRIGECAPAYPKVFRNIEGFDFLQPSARWLEYPFTLPAAYYHAQGYMRPGPVRIIYREEDRTDFHVVFHDPSKRRCGSRFDPFSQAMMLR